MALLWTKMARTYGAKWVQLYGEADDGTWLAGLAGVAPEQVAAGYARLVAEGREWPPGLPEFRALCLERVDASDGAAIAGRMEAHKALPVPPEERARRLEVGRAAIAGARAILRGEVKRDE